MVMKKSLIPSISITWVQTNYSELPEMPETAFYAFSRGGNLLYIGVAYRQLLKLEIDYNIKRFSIQLNGLSIWIGFETYMTYKYLTRSLVFSTECLLIHLNQPIKNSQCKMAYNIDNHLDNLRVRSYDFPLLIPVIRIQNEKFYRS